MKISENLIDAWSVNRYVRYLSSHRAITSIAYGTMDIEDIHYSAVVCCSTGISQKTGHVALSRPIGGEIST